jgi:glutamate dehydrogenase (NADP+)
MSQNALRLPWPRDAVNARLHAACLHHGTRTVGSVSHSDGANIAGFIKVADAMPAQGLV